MAEAVDSTEVQQLSLIVDDCRREMAEAVDSTEVQQPAAAGDEDDRKLYVGGLPQDASQVLFFKHFEFYEVMRY